MIQCWDRFLLKKKLHEFYEELHEYLHEINSEYSKKIIIYIKNRNLIKGALCREYIWEGFDNRQDQSC